MIARWNGKDFKVNSLPTLNKSSREITFSEIEIDFTGESIDDLPLKLQEIQLIHDDEVKYYGYCESFEFPEMDGTKKRTILTLSILSPSKMAQVKTRTIQKQFINLNELMIEIFQPLIDEGFEIVANTLPEIRVSIREAFKPIEKIMNELSNDYNFYWYIDEKKRIFIKNGRTQEPLIQSLQEINEFAGYTYKPKMSAVDYSNIINAKNQNILQFSNEIIPENIIIPNQSEIQFKYPISISKTTGARLANESARSIVGFPLWFMFIDRTVPAGTVTYTILYDEATDDIIIDSAIGFDGEDNDDPTKVILLKRDSNNNTLITGLKNVFGSNITLSSIQSFSAVIKTVTIYQNAIDIEKAKGKVSETGKIESTVDFNGKFITKTDSLDYAKNRVLRTAIKRLTDEIEIIIKGVPNASYNAFIDACVPLTSIIADEEYANDTFIVTDTEIVEQPNWVTFRINARNTNLIENYLDIFRKDEGEATEEELTNQIYSVLIKEEEIIEKRLTIVDGEIIDENS